MKRIIPFYILFSFFLVTFPAYADTVVITGNSESTSSVTTSIQGSGSVTTHIESTVNGNTKTLDSNTPGTFILENSSDDNPSPTINPTSTSASPQATLTPFVKQADHLIKALNIIERIRTFFHDEVNHLLSFFHL